MVPKIPRCTVVMLSQILYYKTKDGGKLHVIKSVFSIYINKLSCLYFALFFAFVKRFFMQ